MTNSFCNMTRVEQTNVIEDVKSVTCAWSERNTKVLDRAIDDRLLETLSPPSLVAYCLLPPALLIQTAALIASFACSKTHSYYADLAYPNGQPKYLTQSALFTGGHHYQITPPLLQVLLRHPLVLILFAFLKTFCQYVQAERVAGRSTLILLTRASSLPSSLA